MKPVVKYASIVAGFAVSVLIGAAVASCLILPYGGEGTRFRFWFEMLGLLGAWVSGIGAFYAAVVALRISNKQSRVALQISTQQINDAVLRDRVRGLHHSMAIVDDLRLRVDYLGKCLKDGNRPLSAITINATSLSRRYEALYDRELYSGIGGDIIARIGSFTAAFLGIETLVASVASRLNHEGHVTVPGGMTWPDGQSPFEKLYGELNDFYTDLEGERKKLDEEFAQNVSLEP